MAVLALGVNFAHGQSNAGWTHDGDECSVKATTACQVYVGDKSFPVHPEMDQTDICPGKLHTWTHEADNSNGLKCKVRVVIDDGCCTHGQNDELRCGGNQITKTTALGEGELQGDVLFDAGCASGAEFRVTFATPI